MTRKEQKEEKRKTILMTALSLFVERGYNETKIADIAAAVPMSMGLMFHYFESKEDLLLELVKMGAEGTRSMAPVEGVPADLYLTGFLQKMFAFAKEQPWVFNMFVLMGQVRRPGMPEAAQEIASKVSAIDMTVELIKDGQKAGVFHDGDPLIMSRCFWAAVQGIIEEMSVNKDFSVPDPSWIVSILK